MKSDWSCMLVYWVLSPLDTALDFSTSTTHAHVWESGCVPLRILYLGSRWRWVVSFMPRQLHTWQKNRVWRTHSTGGWVCPRADLDGVSKRHITGPARGLVTSGFNCVLSQSTFFRNLVAIMRECVLKSYSNIKASKLNYTACICLAYPWIESKGQFCIILFQSSSTVIIFRAVSCRLAFRFVGLYVVLTDRLIFGCGRQNTQTYLLRSLLQSWWFLIRFQVLKAAHMIVTVFCHVAPCNVTESDLRFRYAYCLRHQMSSLQRSIA
jgi:hypothetical protein